MPVYSLDLGFKNAFTSLFKAREICKNADIIDTWLYHADILVLWLLKYC